MEQNDKLRVALLNDSFPPAIDGVANVMVNYANTLHRRGDAVCVATPAYPEVADDYPYPVLRYPSLATPKEIGYRAGDPFSPQLIAALEQQAPDIIHVHCPVVSAVLARLLRARIDAPVIFTYHTKFDIDIRKAIPGRLLQEASVRALVNNISACDEVWVVSEGAGENLRSLGYQGDYIVMENGVDFPRGEAAPEAVDAVRREYGIPADLPVFLFVGRMMWYKGIDISLEALQLAKQTGLDFRFVLTGDGVDRAAIEEKAAALGLADRCIFTGKVLDREKLRAIFGCATLFLFPSTFDTNGIVVREAAACSCPSLLVAGSCAAEGITDGRTGYLFDGTPQDMLRCIRGVCADRAAARQVGRQASQQLYLSWEDAVLRARERYRIVLENWRSGKLKRAEAVGNDFFDGLGSAIGALGETEREMERIRTTAAALTRESVANTRESVRENVAGARQTLRDGMEQAEELLGNAAERVRENREERRQYIRLELEDLHGRYRAYMDYLKGRVSDRIEENREEWQELLQDMHGLWNDQLRRRRNEDDMNETEHTDGTGERGCD